VLLNEDITVYHWLAVMRIIIGLWWIKSVLHKDYPKFVNYGMMEWLNDLLDNHPIQPAVVPLKKIVNFQPKIFPYVMVFAELGLGIALTFGFLTPLASLGAIFLNLNYLAIAGAKPKDIKVNPCFRVEQGQNIAMIAATLVIFAAAGWTELSVDSALGWFTSSLI
jgi:thiosulfate dehydrogenase [quinone] large subunit